MPTRTRGPPRAPATPQSSSIRKGERKRGAEPTNDRDGPTVLKRFKYEPPPEDECDVETVSGTAHQDVHQDAALDAPDWAATPITPAKPNFPVRAVLAKSAPAMSIRRQVTSKPPTPPAELGEDYPEYGEQDFMDYDEQGRPGGPSGSAAFQLMTPVSTRKKDNKPQQRVGPRIERTGPADIPQTPQQPGRARAPSHQVSSPTTANSASDAARARRLAAGLQAATAEPLFGGRTTEPVTTIRTPRRGMFVMPGNQDESFSDDEFDELLAGADIFDDGTYID